MIDLGLDPLALLPKEGVGEDEGAGRLKEALFGEGVKNGIVLEVGLGKPAEVALGDLRPGNRELDGMVMA